MERPGVTIYAAMLAAAIRIDAGFETDIGAVVVSYDCACPVTKKLCPRQRILFRIPFLIRFQMDFLEPVDRVAGSSASWD
jgi:hypothetical protein